MTDVNEVQRAAEGLLEDGTAALVDAGAIPPAERGSVTVDSDVTVMRTANHQVFIVFEGVPSDSGLPSFVRIGDQQQADALWRALAMWLATMR